MWEAGETVPSLSVYLHVCVCLIFSHSFWDYLLNVSCVPGTALGARDTAVPSMLGPVLGCLPPVGLWCGLFSRTNTCPEATPAHLRLLSQSRPACSKRKQDCTGENFPEALNMELGPRDQVCWTVKCSGWVGVQEAHLGPHPVEQHPQLNHRQITITNFTSAKGHQHDY